MYSIVLMLVCTVDEHVTFSLSLSLSLSLPLPLPLPLSPPSLSALGPNLNSLQDKEDTGIISKDIVVYEVIFCLVADHAGQIPQVKVYPLLTIKHTLITIMPTVTVSYLHQTSSFVWVVYVQSFHPHNIECSTSVWLW